MLVSAPVLFRSCVHVPSGFMRDGWICTFALAGCITTRDEIINNNKKVKIKITRDQPKEREREIIEIKGSERI